MRNTPIARSKNLVVQDLENETLVCDLQTNRVFCLNLTAGDVWKLCDGKNDVLQIAEVLSRKSNTKFSVEMVHLTLAKLSKEKLLQNPTLTEPLFSNLSRREVVQRIGLASMVALPVISSVVMPTAAQAQSGCPTCVTLGTQCGSVSDGCGNTLNCGNCSELGPQYVCIGNSCSCVPITCVSGSCGTISNACGNSLNCGSCPPSQTCIATNMCV